MLLIESKTLEFPVNETTRLLLLDQLEAEQFPPLIRSSRRRCFEMLLASAPGHAHVGGQLKELERHLLSNCSDDMNCYTPGELFCFEGFILYLTFSGAHGQGVRAGIIYGSESVGPLRKFELFCQRVRDSLLALNASNHGSSIKEHNFPRWETHVRSFPQGLARFIERQDGDFVRATRCKEGRGGSLRAAELLADRSVRALLRRAQQIRVEGYSARWLTEQLEARGDLSMEELSDAGLMQREVRVRCRKTGHALFDLPSADALALITVSRAKCSQCATSVADEVIEEVFNPTESALALLEDGTWLRNRIYQIIRDLGVPECDIALGPPTAHGESHLVANICGDSFLFALRDGDLSPSYTRRVIETGGETEARNVVVIVTGVAEDEGRMRLYEYAWRHARDGQDVEVSIIEGLGGAQKGIERLFERSVSRTLASDLFVLDSSLGLNASRFVLERFKLLRKGASVTVETHKGRGVAYQHLLATDSYSSQQEEGWEVTELPPTSSTLRLTS